MMIECYKKTLSVLYYLFKLCNVYTCFLLVYDIRKSEKHGCLCCMYTLIIHLSLANNSDRINVDGTIVFNSKGCI